MSDNQGWSMDRKDWEILIWVCNHNLSCAARITGEENGLAEYWHKNLPCPYTYDELAKALSRFYVAMRNNPVTYDIMRNPQDAA